MHLLHCRATRAAPADSVKCAFAEPAAPFGSSSGGGSASVIMPGWAAWSLADAAISDLVMKRPLGPRWRVHACL